MESSSVASRSAGRCDAPDDAEVKGENEMSRDENGRRDGVTQEREEGKKERRRNVDGARVT